MRDTTVRRASRQGTRTLPVEHGRPRTPKGCEPIDPAELAWMIQTARNERDNDNRRTA